MSLTACHTSKRGSTSREYQRREAEITAPNRRPDRSSQSYETMRKQLRELILPQPELSKLMAEASKWVGTPYLYGGTKKSGVDCSGFVMNIFQDALGSKLPRTSRDQQAYCSSVKKSELRPGDLVFFATGKDSGRVSHVGLYIGDGRIVHASSSRGVIISDLSVNYYVKHYHSSGRPAAVSEIYAKSRKNPIPKPKPERDLRPAPAPAPAPIVPDDVIDDMITEKIDSIFNFFD